MHDIVYVEEIYNNAGQANDYLQNGWKLINVLNYGSTNDGQNIVYIVGADKYIYGKYQESQKLSAESDPFKKFI